MHRPLLTKLPGDNATTFRFFAILNVCLFLNFPHVALCVGENGLLAHGERFNALLPQWLELSLPLGIFWPVLLLYSAHCCGKDPSGSPSTMLSNLLKHKTMSECIAHTSQVCILWHFVSQFCWHFALEGSLIPAFPAPCCYWSHTHYSVRNCSFHLNLVRCGNSVLDMGSPGHGFKLLHCHLQISSSSTFFCHRL